MQHSGAKTGMIGGCWRSVFAKGKEEDNAETLSEQGIRREMGDSGRGWLNGFCWPEISEKKETSRAAPLEPKGAALRIASAANRSATRRDAEEKSKVRAHT